MLNSFPVAMLTGSILGFLAGLGIGGGSLLILWLTLVLGTEYPIARGINLLFFIPAAVITCLIRRKQGMVSLKKSYPAIISGCIAAAAVSFFSVNLDLTIMKKLFGGLLLLTGLRELRYKPKKEEP